jgi:gluconokinase
MVFVESVRATGGAFRSQLWRDVMAATLDRPFYVVDEAEGTALGAAALGLIALGTAASPAEALAQLAGNGAPAPAPVAVSRDLVATYAGLRNSLAPLIDDLGAVAGLPRHSTAR